MGIKISLSAKISIVCGKLKEKILKTNLMRIWIEWSLYLTAIYLKRKFRGYEELIEAIEGEGVSLQ